MTATCEPTGFDRVWRAMDWSGACSLARIKPANFQHKPHIWYRGGWWYVGWRYVAPAIRPGDEECRVQPAAVDSADPNYGQSTVDPGH